MDLSNNNNGSSDNLSILYSIDPKKSNPVVVNIHTRNSHDPAKVEGHGRDGDLDVIDVPKAKKDSFYLRSSFNDLGSVTKSNTTTPVLEDLNASLTRLRSILEHEIDCIDDIGKNFSNEREVPKKTSGYDLEMSNASDSKI